MSLSPASPWSRAMRIPEPNAAWCAITDHTADLGLEIRADTFEELLARATGLLLSLAGVFPETGPMRTVRIALTADDEGIMVADWLNEILYLVDGERVIPVEISRLEINGRHLTADLNVASARRAVSAAEPKAITYHQASVLRTDGELVARVIVDM